MPAPPFDKIKIPEELRNRRPAQSTAQLAALREANDAMDERYAGNYVAYVDTWGGEQLERAVVAFAVEAAEFQEKLAKLQPEVRARVQLTQIPDADMLNVPSAWLS